MSNVIDFVYCGRKEWRGFKGSKLVAWVFEDRGAFRPQVKIEGVLRAGPESPTLTMAQDWICSQRR